MRYPRVFRQRMSQDDYDWIRATATDMRMSQQEIGRWAIRLLREELDKVQGASPVLSSKLAEPSVLVARHEAPKRHKRVTKPEADASVRDGRSVEDVALRKMRQEVARIERDRPAG